MGSELIDRYPEIRDFFLPRIAEHSQNLGAKIEDIENEKVRTFFSTHEFCESWIADLSVDSRIAYALDCEGMEVNKLAELYTMTEFGSVMFANELFCFAESSSGGPWVVSLKTGEVFKMLPTWSYEEEMSACVDYSWESFSSLIDHIKRTGLEDVE